MNASEKNHHSAHEAAHVAMECLAVPTRFPRSILWDPDLVQIVRALRLFGPASKAEVSVAVGLSPGRAKRYLEMLHATGLVTKKTLQGGLGHAVQYELNRDAVYELSVGAKESLIDPRKEISGGVSFRDLVRAYIQGVAQ